MGQALQGNLPVEAGEIIRLHQKGSENGIVLSFQMKLKS
jgi:hypothetical protein